MRNNPTKKELQEQENAEALYYWNCVHNIDIGRGVKLHSFNACVYPADLDIPFVDTVTGEFDHEYKGVCVLLSYTTFVAVVIRYPDGQCIGVDMLRYRYHYTVSSAKQIARFFKDNGVTIRYTWRAI